MKQLNLQIPDDKVPFFMELIENLKFVKITNKKREGKEAVLKNIEQGFKEMKAIEEGKLQGTPLTDFLYKLQNHTNG